MEYLSNNMISMINVQAIADMNNIEKEQKEINIDFIIDETNEIILNFEDL